MAAIIRMIATTISNSINENPLCFLHAHLRPANSARSPYQLFRTWKSKDRIRRLARRTISRLMKQ
jgi:hypothetical protein